MTRYSILWYLAQIFICVDWIYFFHGFLKDKNNKDFILTIMSVVLYYMLSVIGIKLISNDSILNLLSVIAITLILYIIKRPKPKQLIFSIFIFYGLQIISETLAMLIYYASNYLFNIKAYSIVFIYEIVNLIIFYIAIKLYRKQEMLININILFVILLLAFNQEKWLMTLSNIITDSEYTLNDVYTSVIMQLTVLIIIIFLIKDYINLKKIKTENEIKLKNKEELKKQINTLGEKQSILNKVYKEIKDDELSIEKLDDLSKDLKEIRMNFYSDNPSVNALLSYFNNECIKENIVFNVEVKGSIKDKLDNYEIGRAHV